MKHVVTLGGLHGTGKSSVADMIADELKLRRTSAGMIFRQMAAEKGMSLEEFSRYAEDHLEIDEQLDSTLTHEAEKGNIVLDGQLAAWMAKEHADFRILLTAPEEVRIQRIADRDGVDYEHAHHETLAREESERERYKEYYGIDVSDHSIYDLILNTDKFTLDEVVDILVNAIKILWKVKTDNP
jgi:cytidylate kinase